MPESGLSIRVWEQDDQRHVVYGDGVVEDLQSEDEEATSAADAIAQAEGRTVVVEE